MANTPKGTRFFVATAFGSSQDVSSISNATSAVVTCAGHGYSNGDVVEIRSGWGNLDHRVFVISSVTTNTFTLAGTDTSSTTLFPSGSSAGSVREITTFVQVTKVMNAQSQGGDPKTVNYAFYDSDVEYSINDGFTATSYSFEMDDDDTTAGYTALRSLTDNQTETCLKMLLKSGSTLYFPGRVALNDVPTLNDGQINKQRIAFNGTARHSRYTA